MLCSTLVPYQYNLWIGGCQNGITGYSTSGLHHDFHDNLYVMVKGKKYFRIFSPMVAELLEPVGTIETIYENGLICYDQGRRSDGNTKSDLIFHYIFIRFFAVYKKETCI